MKYFVCLILSVFSFAIVHANDAYHFLVDLTDCRNDQLRIELTVSGITENEVIYRIPKIVPGTYEIYNFGKYISDFLAVDSNGVELNVEQLDKNSWKITQAEKLSKITYKVDDTWDAAPDPEFVFEPGGSNFEEGSNFVLNTHCLFGYFDGMIRKPYEIKIKHASNFYGACSLTDVTYDKDIDTYHVPNYQDLQDAPMMYCEPDTTVLNIGGAQILISLYSPNKIMTSKFVGEKIQEILIAQQAYLGGTLPIKKYAYLIYLTPKKSGSGSNGALEHSYSSLYFLPELEPAQLAQSIKDISAHEFFHIVTPLSIHAEQIGDFDYANPKMSEHLWLYEGLTEYAASLVQVKYGKMSVKEYLKVIHTKIQRAKYFNDTIPFTEMSKGCLDVYKDQYGNVYQKGALIGLCLDLQLRYLSKGAYGVQELMKDLSKSYGKDKSFKDEELFAKITSLTYPEIGTFLKRYVADKEPLPIKESLALVGVEIGSAGAIKKEVTFGGVAIGYDPASKHIKIFSTKRMDDFGKQMGYQEDDELIKVNKKTITSDNAQALIESYLKNAKEGDVLKVVVLRKQLTTGKMKKVKLKATIFPVTPKRSPELTLTASPTPEQLQIRNAWIGQH
ncbi:MAG TPA: peptidase M61 [Bacteroidia bacterium]|jgi:predicted metalloprotease with PDZ domain|nr:peptidase M61 [Bacteroidia bacterium]